LQPDSGTLPFVSHAQRRLYTSVSTRPQVVAGATGASSRYGATGVAAWRGREAEATELIQANMDGVTSRGEGRGLTSQQSAALPYNGLGRYSKALGRRRAGV
jgi:hypothetical protein